MIDISQAIKETLALFKNRPAAGDWARNISEGSVSLKTPQEWSNYYAFLSNPVLYDPTKQYKASKEQDEIPAYPKSQEVKVFQNGTDQIIVVTNKIDDEKVPA